MTRNEEIIETLKLFYLLGSVDGIATSISPNIQHKFNFEKRLKEWWSGNGKNVFPDFKIDFNESDEK